MSDKATPHKMRRNRYKKNRLRAGAATMKRLFLGRLLIGLRFAALLALLIAVSAVFMVAYASITTSAYFSARTISIEGNRHLSQQEIFDQAGLSPGDNLLALNLRVIRKRLMAHPWIQSAQVTRRIPRTLTIRVLEQQPLAVLDLGRRYLINRQGSIFKAAGEGDPMDLPVITGIAPGDLSLGQAPLSAAMETVLQVLALSLTDQSAVALDRISSLHLDNDTGVSLTIGSSGRQIKLGFGPFERKNRHLRRVLVHLDGDPQLKEYSIIDADNPERIVIRTRSAPQANEKGV